MALKISPDPEDFKNQPIIRADMRIHNNTFFLYILIEDSELEAKMRNDPKEIKKFIKEHQQELSNYLYTHLIKNKTDSVDKK